MNYTELRAEFKKIFDENLEGYNFLNKKNFGPIRYRMKGQGLKFYQYRSPSPRTLNQIKNCELSCSNPKMFNDVFEGMVKSKDDDKIEIKEVIERASNAVSIACFSETPANQLMYAHYAASYKGLCIEYDYDRMLNCIPDIGYFYPVIYQHSPSSLAKMRELSKSIDKHISAIAENKIALVKIDDLISYFVHKPYIWKYEREWRLIVPVSQFHAFFTNESVNEMFHTMKNRFDCISAIYLAANIEDAPKINGENYKDELIEIVKEKNSKRKNPGEYIKVYQTHIIESSYKIGRKEIKL